MACKRRVGIVGFGRLGSSQILHHQLFIPLLGQFLFEEVKKRNNFEVAFVWNRTAEKMRGVVEDELVLQDLADCASKYV